jgi:hypothetical protein
VVGTSRGLGCALSCALSKVVLNKSRGAHLELARTNMVAKRTPRASYCTVNSMHPPLRYLKWCRARLLAAAARTPAVLARAALVLALAPSAGCNIVQGFQDAGDSLFPEQSTHLDAPGLRLAAGQYSSLDLARGAELYLLSREPDDQSGQLFVVRYADARVCVIPSVGRYSTTTGAQRRFPLLSYFHDGSTRGMLHFADMGCTNFDLEFEDARLPIAETDSGVVIWAGTDLWLATPETGSQMRLAENVDDIIGPVLGQSYGLMTGGRIELFAKDFTVQGLFGQQVSTVRGAGNTLFYMDEAGIHRLVVSQANSQGVADELLAADGCSLGNQDGTWVTFRSPCSGGPVIAIHEPTGRKFTLPFDAKPEQLKLTPARGSPGEDPTRDPFWFFGLRDGADADSENTLVIRTPAGAELTLGAHATLKQLSLQESDSETYGYALVDVAGSGSDKNGRYLWWDSSGQSKALAEHVLAQPSRLVVDFDGSLGKLAVTSGDRLNVLTEGVPWPSFEYTDAGKQWTVLFHDLDLTTQRGTLSAFYGSLDALSATPTDQPFTAPALEAIAHNVGVFRSASLNKLLSGVIYLADFDPVSATGRLEYRSMELRFTALVNNGVSDYRVFQDQLLYTIPRGDNAGIWLVAGK